MKNSKLTFVLAFLLFVSFQMEAQHNHGSHDHSHDTKTKKEKVKQANGITDIIYVYGNCEMCKKRIEGSLSNRKGIQSANWDVGTKVLTVKYDYEIITKEEIKKLLAKAGHDTDKFIGDQKTYDNLPACCQYERLGN